MLVLAEPLTLRPSRAERRQGLQLRWPQMMRAGTVTEGFFIDIVNAGASVWTPDDEAFQVVGVLAEPDAVEVAFGWASIGQPPSVPLAPGDYARVPVVINRHSWDELTPGHYTLHATLVGLNLRADPLPVHLSAEQIARQCSYSRPRRTSPEKLHQMLDVESERLKAMIAAGSLLAAITELVVAATSDAEAVTAISSLLGCDEAAGWSVFHATLQDLRPGNAPTLQSRLRETQRRRDELENQSSET